MKTPAARREELLDEFERSGMSGGANLQKRLASAVIKRAESGHTMSETVNYTVNYTYDDKGNRVRAQWSRWVDGGGAVNGTDIILNEGNRVSFLFRARNRLQDGWHMGLLGAC